MNPGALMGSCQCAGAGSLEGGSARGVGVGGPKRSLEFSSEVASVPVEGWEPVKRRELSAAVPERGNSTHKRHQQQNPS